MKRLATTSMLAFALATGATAATVHADDTIADLVVATSGEFDDNANNYDILLNALVAADLVDAVADPGATLTVFAPNDGAFMQLAADLGWDGGSEAETWDFLVDALTGLGGGDPIPVLTDVLLYHVVGEELTLQQIVLNGAFKQPIETLLGATIQPKGIRLIDNEPNLADPKLLIPSTFNASNGVIFTIDRVLIPIQLPS